MNAVSFSVSDRLSMPRGWLVLLVVSLMVCAGCSSNKQMYSGDLAVRMSEQMKGDSWAYPSFEVDLVAVNDQNKARWLNYPVDQYFQPGDNLRANAAKHTMRFSNDDPDPKTLSKDDKLWDTWKQREAFNLIVLANLPGTWQPEAGQGDPRRLVLPLDKSSWPSSWLPFETNVVTIEARPTGMVAVTPETQDASASANGSK